MSKLSSPFIFRVSFYNQSNNHSQAGLNAGKNAAHIDYIATRPGVDLGEHEFSKDPISDDDVNNMFELTNREKKEMYDIDPQPETAAGHVKYAEERPGSHGLFDGSGKIPNMSDIQQELQENKGIVWRMILSLKEEDAQILGYTERSKWEDTLRAKTAEAANEMGIKESNLRWVAAFHQEKGHPHVHLVLWEKDPKRTKGKLSDGELTDVKRSFMREIYADEKSRLYLEKTAKRDLMRDLAQGDMQKYVSLLKDIKNQNKDVERELEAIGQVQTGIAPKLYREDEKEIIKQLSELAEMMPDKGRIAFQFMPEEAKEKSLLIADSILQGISFKESLTKYLNSVEEITKHSVINEASLIKARENAYNDLQKRIANVVLKSAAEANKLNYLEVDQKTVDKNKDSFLLADGKPEQDLERDIIQATTKHLAAFGLSEQTINNVYQTWLPEINTNKNLEETNLIVSEAISTIEARNQTIYSHEIKNSDLDYFSDVINKELPNPNEKVEYLTSTLLTKGQLLGAMENSVFSKELDPEEVALPLNVALRESGATFSERKHFFEKWTTNNEISLDLKQLNKDTNKVPILTKEQWNETCKNLNVEPTSIDWRTNEKEQLNRQKLEELVKDLKEDPNVFTEHQERYKPFTISVAMNNAKTENQLMASLTKYSENLPLDKQISEEETKDILNKWKLQDLNQVKVFSSILTSAGMERKEILNQLSPLGFTKEKQEEISDYIRLVQVKLNQDRFISFNEVKKTFTIINGEETRFKYPYSNEQIINVNPKDTGELVSVFKGAKFLEGSDLKHTAFWMDQILLRGGVENSFERKDVLDTWAKNNNLNEKEEYKGLERGANSYFVGNKKFDEICKTISLEHLKLPWENKSLLTVKKDEMNAFVESVTKNFTVEKVATKPERIEIRDIMVKALKNVVETESEYKEKLSEFMDKFPEKERLNHTEIEEEAKTIKREDYQYVQKALNVEDLAEKTITNYVTVLRTTGLDDEQTKEAIYSWKDRTNLKMDKEKLNVILTKSLVSFNEKEAWGQTPFLSKKQFEDLSKELNVSSPYLWKSTFPSMNMLAKNIWKAVSKAIDQEQAQAQAQAEIQKKVMERQRQGKTKQVQNQNQDHER